MFFHFQEPQYSELSTRSGASGQGSVRSYDNLPRPASSARTNNYTAQNFGDDVDHLDSQPSPMSGRLALN